MKGRAKSKDDYLILTDALRQIDYKDSNKLADKCLKKAEEVNEAQYNRLLQEKNEASTEREYKTLVKLFKEMNGYKDTEKLANECEENAKAAAVAAEAYAKYNILLNQKKNATTGEEYETLVIQFKGMNGYKDTEKLANECAGAVEEVRYNQLIKDKNKAITENQYQNLFMQFKNMDGYKDSKKLAKECENEAIYKRELQLKKEMQQKQESEEQSKRQQSKEWRLKGLCGYCGGQLGFGRKCKSCKHKN
jgi:heme-degrading monooxygenase HmoA